MGSPRCCPVTQCLLSWLQVSLDKCRTSLCCCTREANGREAGPARNVRLMPRSERHIGRDSVAGGTLNLLWAFKFNAWKVGWHRRVSLQPQQLRRQMRRRMLTSGGNDLELCLMMLLSFLLNRWMSRWCLRMVYGVCIWCLYDVCSYAWCMFDVCMMYVWGVYDVIVIVTS